MISLMFLLACNGGPGGLDAGVARVRLPVPIGLPTAGGEAADAGESTPFSDTRPGSTRVFGHPDVKALVLSRDPGQLAVIVRLDAWAIFPGLRDQVVTALGGAAMPGMHDNLILVASRTWSGPARYADGGDWVTWNADTTDPQIQRAIVEAVAEAVGTAWNARVRAELGTGVTTINGGFVDQRCEDGEDEGDGTTPLLAVRRNGELLAVLAAYPVQGSVLDADALTLSQDVGGAIENAVADFIDDDAEVIVLPSWSGDLGPADPAIEAQESPNRPVGYDQLDAVGQLVGERIGAGLDSLTWSDEPTIDLRTTRLPMDWKSLGYRSIEFPYDDGGWACEGSNGCTQPTPVELLDHACTPFDPSEPAPSVAPITVGQLGELSVVTLPAAPSTSFAAELRYRLRDVAGEDTMIVGYAQDYLGSALLEEDWWYGGDATADTVWGPRQGTALLDGAEAAFTAWSEGAPFEDDLPATSAVLPDIVAPYAPSAAIDAAVIYEQPAAEVGPTDTVKLIVQGSDPWYGPPVAHIETAAGARITHANGRAIDSDGMAFWVDVRPNPTLTVDPDATERTWYWTFNLAPRHKLAGGYDLPAGSYRLVVSVPLDNGNTAKVTSDEFNVTE